MKPSQRIREIADKQGIPNNEAVPAWIIASYLDEEYAKKHNHEVGTKCNEC